MKKWGVICLIGALSFINDGKARSRDVFDRPDPQEEKIKGGVSTKDEPQNGKTEPPSVLRESGDGLKITTEEIEKPDYVIITTDTPSGGSGGVPSLDPTVIAELVLPPFSEPEVPWWERWWNNIVKWFGGETAEPKPGK